MNAIKRHIHDKNNSLLVIRTSKRNYASVYLNGRDITVNFAKFTGKKYLLKQDIAAVNIVDGDLNQLSLVAGKIAKMLGLPNDTIVDDIIVGKLW